MNELEKKLHVLNPALLNNFHESMIEVELLLSKYDVNFPSYTDHSIKHTKEVFNLASQLLTLEEINNLNEDEIYILSMSCILHDIGMCVPKKKLIELSEDKYSHLHGDDVDNITENLIRDIHHELSYDFIIREYELLKIPNSKYAEAIALVSKGHRKVALDEIKIYKPKYFVKSGRDFACLPYLACILRLADELDITNIRTPELLLKYYMPNNEISVREWNKHISTTQINFTEDKVIFEITCSDQNNLAALENQFEKIQNVSNYCQKIIRTISNTEDRRFKLKLLRIEPKYNFVGFDPKGIKFSFNVQNVINTFIGEDLYGEKLVGVREGLQNSIDSCRYKKGIFGDAFTPEVKVIINESTIEIIDNGLGMDEFIIENFFGRLGSSFYEQKKIKKGFEAIGQFGVGVFSYFLLGEYIEIQTKAENGKSLKFLIDKDPKNYFHFLDHCERTEVGTSIKIHLKKEIREKIKYDDYFNYINKVFKHIEFDILISENSETALIKSKPYLPSNEEIRNKVKPKYFNTPDLYQTLNYSIDNKDFAGEVKLLINKLPIGIDSIKSIRKYFDYEAFDCVNDGHNSSQISVSQKGVFVNHYSSTFLSNVVGGIDLKSGLGINISRKEFRDEKSIDNIIVEFEYGLINEILKHFKKELKDFELAEVSNDFVEIIWRHIYRTDIGANLISCLGEGLRFNVFSGVEDQFLSINELKKKGEDFVLLSKEDDKSKAFNILNLPVLQISGYEYDGAYANMLDILKSCFNYGVKGVMSSEDFYQIMTATKAADLYKKNNLKLQVFRSYGRVDYQELNINGLGMNMFYNEKVYKDLKDWNSQIVINVNHPFIVKILEHFDVISKDSKFVKIISNSIEEVVAIISNKKVTMKNVSELNNIINSYNNSKGFWDFSMEDFEKMV